MRPYPKDIPTYEEWLPVVGFELLYLISRWGQVFSLISDRLLKPQINNSGYLIVVLHKDGKPYAKLVHRIVMEAFVGPCQEDIWVNHRDGDKTNNFLSNLEYTTISYNHRHAYKTGLRSKVGVNHHMASFIEADISIIRKRFKDGEKQKVIAADYNVSREAISHIVNRRTWAHIV